MPIWYNKKTHVTSESEITSVHWSFQIPLARNGLRRAAALIRRVKCRLRSSEAGVGLYSTESPSLNLGPTSCPSPTSTKVNHPSGSTKRCFFYVWPTSAAPHHLWVAPKVAHTSLKRTRLSSPFGLGCDMARRHLRIRPTGLRRSRVAPNELRPGGIDKDRLVHPAHRVEDRASVGGACLVGSETLETKNQAEEISKTLEDPRISL